MKSKREKFEEILRSDEFGLLANPQKKSVKRASTTLEQDFESILAFYNKNNRLPSKTGSLLEKKLAFRLDALRKNPEASIKLQQLDSPGLLINHKDETLGIDDPFGLLDTDENIESITTLRHVENTGRLDPAYIARRTQCAEYDSKYRPLFESVSKEISEGKRRVTSFNPDDLEAGRFFILQGMLTYLERDASVDQTFDFNSGSKIRRDGRTRCIFNNGTESNLLYRSLIKALEKDGFSVSEPIYGATTNSDIVPEDKQKGFVYVLKSRSKDPHIQAIPNLYKIGFSSGEVKDRIRNAVNEPTYLMSDVIIVEQARCYNMSVRGLEDTIHKVFGDANVDITIKDHDGNVHHPKEWFSVPLNVIEQAIAFIVAGKADEIHYNPDLKLLVYKE
jgi:hypothetical protein